MVGNGDWRTVHAALSRLARQRAAADAEEGRWLLAAQRLRAHEHLGMGSFVEYIERLFGYRPRTTHEKLRVAEALERLPLLAGALERGDLSWSAVRELTRVAVAETEATWLAAGAAKTLRELEDLVAGRRPGDLPTDAADPRAVRHVVRFEVTAETYATLREAFAALRRRSESSLSDDALLLELARRVLGGPADEGRSSYQVALSLCPGCGAARQAAGNRSVSVDSTVAEMACCDGQCLELEPEPASAHMGAAAPRTRQSIPPALRRAVLHRDERRCQVPGCKNDGTVTALHADGSRYGAKLGHPAPTPPRASPSPLPPSVLDKVRSGLCNMGFRRGEVERVLRELQAHEELRAAAADQWLRTALLRLTRPTAASASDG